MLCPKFEQLTPREKAIYIGQLVHVVQSKDEYFDLGNDLINIGAIAGLFDSVKILPEDNPGETKV